MEPPPKQGCENGVNGQRLQSPKSQWNPRRSRGASDSGGNRGSEVSRLSGTPAEAGVRDDGMQIFADLEMSLSGTPAEAGVRG